MWRKREAEWEREKQARERLMAEVRCGHYFKWVILCECPFILQVMAERQQQIDRKLDILKAQQVINYSQ